MFPSWNHSPLKKKKKKNIKYLFHQSLRFLITKRLNNVQVLLMSLSHGSSCTFLPRTSSHPQDDELLKIFQELIIHKIWNAHTKLTKITITSTTPTPSSEQVTKWEIHGLIQRSKDNKPFIFLKWNSPSNHLWELVQAGKHLYWI